MDRLTVRLTRSEQRFGAPAITSNSELAIRFDGVGKRYRQYGGAEAGRLRAITQRLGGRASARDLWALHDISFELAAGATLGIIGRNGSGKTTALRLMSGISAPTVGALRVVGRIAPLIGVGVGFNPELSGRENVFINGRLMGMTEAALKHDFDSIVDFSEIEAFIDTPVKFYSSGMFLRLAFAVIVHMRPEILVVDEVLAVGDMAFQLKCNDKMREIQQEGSTIVIVTHNLQVLPRMTDRVIVLSHGRMIFDGKVEEGLGAYQRLSATESESAGAAAMMMREEPTSQNFLGGACVTMSLSNASGASTDGFADGEEIFLDLDIAFDNETDNPLLGVMVAAVGQSAALAYFSTQVGDLEQTYGPDRPMKARIALQNPFLSGGYQVTVGVFESKGRGMLGTSHTTAFHISSTGRSQGLIQLAPRITIDGSDLDLSVDRRNLRQ